MNPRTSYEDGDSKTARAFVELFRRFDDDDDIFKFSVDSTVSEDDTVEARYVANPRDVDSDALISIVCINNEDAFERVRTEIESMGLKVVEEEHEDAEADSLGEYHRDYIGVVVPNDVSGDWDVPHLLVYGSASPEIKEAFYAAFGTDTDKYNIANIRNHYVVYGSGVSEASKDTLSDAIQRSNEFFDDYKRDAVSNVRTADVF